MREETLSLGDGRSVWPGAPQRLRTVAGDTSWGPSLPAKVVQPIQLHALGGCNLCYRVLNQPVHATDKSGITLGIGAKVSFNTYLNSFYEHYWLRHAPVDEIALRLYGTGHVLVEWFRATPDGLSCSVVRKRIDLGGTTGGLAPVPLASSPAGAGRLVFTVTALSSQATLLAGHLETTTAPRHPVSLGIGLCTFNREAALTANLRRIVDSPYYRWAQPHIAVVNQGAPFNTAGIADLLQQEARIRVIEQANLGGAGGFTRSAVELLKEGQSTHVLFMDDDIEIDPSVLVTTHAFAARTLDPTVVGGAMLDLVRPSTMYEAGAVISGRNILRPAHRGQPLDCEQSLDDLAWEIPIHFSGWWYCAIPAEVFRDCGLPLPIFIRGDDMEYGVRLKTKGIPTVSLPPVSVWHEPFYAKPPGWQLYYDLRNRLIFASCYPELVRLDSPTVILRRLVDSLLKHDYVHADLVLRAVDDFLAGPAVMNGPADALHADVTALAARHVPQDVTRPDPLDVRLQPMRKPSWKTLSVLRGLISLWFGPPSQGSGRLRSLDAEGWQWADAMELSRYVLSDRYESFRQLYEYDRSKFRSCLKRGVRAVLRYGGSSRTAAELWRAAHADLSSWTRWEDIFKSASLRHRCHAPTPGPALPPT